MLNHLRHKAAVILPILAILTLGLGGCAADLPQIQGKSVFVNGFNEVRVVPEETAQQNDHPVSLTPTQVGTLLHRVLFSEKRNVFHRLISGEAAKTRAFHDDEITLLAPPLSRALAQAGPNERVYFRLGRPGSAGSEESTTGWIFVQGPSLHLLLSEVHDVHGPGPDINKYIREMPDIPQAPTPFAVTFEPEEYLLQEVSEGSWWAPVQLENLEIRFRKALADLPPYKILEGDGPAVGRPTGQ